MPELLDQQKINLRSSFRERLKGLNLAQVEDWSGRIQNRVLSSSPFQKARSLALYHPYENEVRTQQLFEEARKVGKKVAYPYAGKAQAPLRFFWVDSLSQLSPTTWGPLGPNPQENLAPALWDAIDLMVIPGLVFDRRGGRVGRGKGFYDRTLKIFSGVKLGVAYAFQVIESVPRAIWDEPVQYLATEGELFLAS